MPSGLTKYCLSLLVIVAVLTLCFQVRIGQELVLVQRTQVFAAERDRTELRETLLDLREAFSQYAQVVLTRGLYSLPLDENVLRSIEEVSHFPMIWVHSLILCRKYLTCNHLLPMAIRSTVQ